MKLWLIPVAVVTVQDETLHNTILITVHTTRTSCRLLCQSMTLDPYIRRAVPTGISHLMGQGRTIRLLAKIYEEVGVDSQSSFLSVNIDLQHVGALLDKIITIELLIPTAEKWVGYVYPLAIQAQLNHLRSTSKSMPLIIEHTVY